MYCLFATSKWLKSNSRHFKMSLNPSRIHNSAFRTRWGKELWSFLPGSRRLIKPMSLLTRKITACETHHSSPTAIIFRMYGFPQIDCIGGTTELWKNRSLLPRKARGGNHGLLLLDYHKIPGVWYIKKIKGYSYLSSSKQMLKNKLKRWGQCYRNCLRYFLHLFSLRTTNSFFSLFKVLTAKYTVRIVWPSVPSCPTR